VRAASSQRPRLSYSSTRIACERLPLIVTHDKDVEAVSTLVHAGQVAATMQVVLPPWGGGPQPGVVVRGTTRLAWMSLAAPVPDDSRRVI